jgi:hypothetical protein
MLCHKFCLRAGDQDTPADQQFQPEEVSITKNILQGLALAPPAGHSLNFGRLYVFEFRVVPV